MGGAGKRWEGWEELGGAGRKAQLFISHFTVVFSHLCFLTFVFSLLFHLSFSPIISRWRPSSAVVPKM